MLSLRTLTPILALAANPLLAQDLLGDDLILSGKINQNGIGTNFFNGNYSSFNGSVCMGSSCSPSESNGLGNPPLRLKWTVTDIIFEDTSTSSGIPSNDWRIMVNDGGIVSGTHDRFSIRDETGGTIPVSFLAGAPDNSLWVESDGSVGLGTSMPQTDLHIVGIDTPSIMLQQIGSFGVKRWEMAANELGFFVKDTDASTVPFMIEDQVPDDSLYLASSGFVGIGTDSPEERLHIRSNATNTDAFALFDANGVGSDAAFRLRQNGLIPTTWEFRNQQDSGRLNVGIAGGNTPLKIDNAANNNLIRLGRNGLPGEVNITGTLVVNNTQLNVPDYVFAHDYALRPLSEVQAFIDENSHLPEVPSEADIKANGVDMTAMQMVLLKKVEELTLYTLEQDAMIAALHDKAAQSDAQAQLITSLQLRLEALEATR